MNLKKYWPLIITLLILGAMLISACSDQTQASNDNATTAASKWGNSPPIHNYYEYKQLSDIYVARDNPKLILYVYTQSMDGSLRCFGKSLGYGIPYGTSWSQDIGSGTQGSIPEPNALYPSKSTNADWVRLINDDGTTSLTFLEPNAIITPKVLPCKPLD